MHHHRLHYFLPGLEHQRLDQHYLDDVWIPIELYRNLPVDFIQIGPGVSARAELEVAGLVPWTI
jgi:hypothetical protein